MIEEMRGKIQAIFFCLPSEQKEEVEERSTKTSSNLKKNVRKLHDAVFLP